MSSTILKSLLLVIVLLGAIASIALAYQAASFPVWCLVVIFITQLPKGIRLIWNLK